MRKLLFLLFLLPIAASGQIYIDSYKIAPSAPPPPTQYVLDLYPGASAGYSIRKLRSAYSGNVVRVRRASDNTETDIGFGAGDSINVAALSTFCSGTNCFVTTWYDQAGSFNATQTTAANQPRIFAAATGYLGYLEFGSTRHLSTSQSANTGSFTVFHTGFVVFAPTNSFVFGATSNTNVYYGVGQNGSTAASQANYAATYYADGVQVTSPNRDKIFDAAVGFTLYSTLHATTQAVNYRIAYPEATFSNVQFKEYIIYNSDKSADRVNIENAIDSFYNLY